MMYTDEFLHSLLDSAGFVTIKTHTPIIVRGFPRSSFVGAVTQVTTASGLVLAGGGRVRLALVPRGDDTVDIAVDNIKKVKIHEHIDQNG